LPATLRSGDRAIAFGHDAVGRETNRRINERFSLTQVWDSVGRLTGQSLTAAPCEDSSPRVLHQRSYTYRPDHYVTGLAENSGNTQLVLDPIGRVTAVNAPGWRETNAYDSAGNQTSAHWPTTTELPGPTGDRAYAGTLLTHCGSVRYEYDAAGTQLALVVVFGIGLEAVPRQGASFGGTGQVVEETDSMPGDERRTPAGELLAVEPDVRYAENGGLDAVPGVAVRAAANDARLVEA
jgi:YD repeat-containing protein